MDKTEMDSRLWTVEEVATYLGRTKGAIHLMCYRGQLPYIKMGGNNSALRFDSGKIKDLVESCTVDAYKRV